MRLATSRSSIEDFGARLAEANDPSLRRGMLVRVLGRDERSPEVVALGEEIRTSSRAGELLSERLPDGTIPRHPYAKWDGAHWILSALAELGYPPGDESLVPLREQVLAWLLSPGRARRVRKAVAGRARSPRLPPLRVRRRLLEEGMTEEGKEA